MRGWDRRLSALFAGPGLARIAICVAMLAILTVATAAAQQTQDSKIKVSDKPLSAEQLAVYRAVLAGWMGQDVPAMNLAIQTEPLEEQGPEGDADCAKGLDLEPASPGVVHRFRQEDLPQLGSGRTFTLVDPDRGRKEVENNDPEKGIRNGTSIDDAVRNGFAHGLTTLSEIRFDKQHKVAIVSYGFRCGGLCGNGGTVVLIKTDGAWKRKSSCQDWVSRQTQPAHPPGLASPESAVDPV